MPARQTIFKTKKKTKKIVTGCHKNTCKLLHGFRSSMNSRSLFQGLNSTLPKNPRKLITPLEPFQIKYRGGKKGDYSPANLVAFIADIVSISLHGEGSWVLKESTSWSCDGISFVKSLILQAHQSLASNIVVQLSERVQERVKYLVFYFILHKVRQQRSVASCGTASLCMNRYDLCGFHNSVSHFYLSLIKQTRICCYPLQAHTSI